MTPDGVSSPQQAETSRLAADRAEGEGAGLGRRAGEATERGQRCRTRAGRLVADYFPEAAAVEWARAPQIEQIVDGIGASRVEVVPVPHDCVDGFAGAFWRRPEAYLDPQVRAGISSFSILPDDVVDRAVAELRADLESGVWHERHADLFELDEIDLGYRLIVAD